MTASDPAAARREAPLERAQRELVRLREEVRSVASHTASGFLHRDFFAAGGKLLRSRVVLFATAHCAESVRDEADWEAARRTALAIELGHAGSLFHDDIVDRSPVRRGLPALHRRVGVRAAALSGAHLIALANALFASLPSPLARRSSSTALRMAGGQLRESESVGRVDLDPEEYLRIASRKTAGVFELAAFSGAWLGGATPSERNALARFGHHLGVAFQLFDDLEDFETTNTQRPATNDLRERVHTLPVLLGCARQDAIGKRLRDLLVDDGLPLAEERAAEVCGLLVASGCLGEAARWALDQRDRARRQLEKLAPSAARQALGELLTDLSPARAPAPGAPEEAR